MKIEVDYTLTPENAAERGFEWFADQIYDPEADDEANKELLELVEAGGMLGAPASMTSPDNGGVGLYKPLEI